MPPDRAAAMHTALAETLAIIGRQERAADKARHLATLEDTLYRLAGKNRALELIPLRLASFHHHWPEPAPNDAAYRSDLGVLIGDLTRLREALRTPEQLHVSRSPQTRRPRRRRT